MSDLPLHLRARIMREGGQLQRCHGTPHHGEYSVAEHSWQAAMLLRMLHPSAPPELIWAVMFHDVAERFTGDVPHPAKTECRALRDALQLAEERHMRVLGLHETLTEEEQQWVRAVDILELYLWCLDQEDLGNKNVVPMARTITAWFERHRAVVPEPVLAFLAGLNESWTRGPSWLLPPS